MSEDNRARLDYYTKNMTTHATIIVAVVFGLFSILGIASNKGGEPRLQISIVYVILALLGCYEIYRFNFYGSEAKRLSEDEFGIRNLPEKDKQNWLERIVNPVVKYLFTKKLVYVCFLLFATISYFVVYSKW